MLRMAVFALLTAAGSAAAQPPAPEDRGGLPVATPAEIELAPGATHAWSVGMEAGQAYFVEVHQLETYLELRWSAEGQQRRINDRQGRTGREEMFWVAASAGTGTLTVGSLSARPGRYRIALAAPHPASEPDRERHRSEADAVKPDLAVRREAAGRFAALGLPHRQLRVLDRLSYLAVAQGQFAQARQAAEECASLARAAALQEELSSCLCGLANAVEQQGELDLAMEAYGQAISLREGLGDPVLLAMALHDSANVLTHRGDYDESETRQRRALALAAESGDEMAQAIMLMDLGALAGARGRVEEAVAAFENGRMAARRRGNRQVEAVATLNAGLAYGQAGAIERSIARIEEALALAEAQGMKPTVAMARLALGAEHDDAGRLEAAQRELEAGVALARSLGDAKTLAAGEGVLGWVLARRGQADAAETHLDAALTAARDVDSRLEEATALLFQGKARILSRRLDEAKASLSRAGSMFREMARMDDEGRVELASAQAERAGGNLAEALARVTEALARFESVRTQVALADQRARYLGFRREAYDVAVGILVERDRREPGQGHLARAFEMTERARARSLVEEVAARRSGRSPVPVALAEAHRRALDRLGHVQRRLVEAHTSAARPDAARLARMERELGEAVAEEEGARRRLREAVPVGLDPIVAASAADLASGLAIDEAIVEYHVGPDASWLFTVTREGLAVFALPGEAALRQQVDDLRRLLAQPRTLGAATFAAAGRRAFDTLLAPALRGRPHLRRLRVVPDGPLWEIPFEALVTGAPTGPRYADVPYVLRTHTIAYQPAAAMPRPPAASGPRLDLVAFADPVLPIEGARGETVARLERAVFREGDRWSLAPLACARQEARDVAAVFGPTRGRVHLREAALESRVKADPDVARARYLLFSTHALLSEAMPSQSALVLSLAGDGDQDGLLQVHEIDALTLDADLVVLSACETALGDNVRGEGLLGLARAFFHAGARRLVASLWKVADCSTAAMTTDLFRRLHGQAEPDVADALRRAKLRMLARPAYAHPYYWAPFVLVG